MTHTADIATPGADPPPGGAAVHALCPLCEYDLRGLAEPRCPECGYRFDWRDLRDPARRKHPYLFEHHPERNVRSFLRTMLGHLRPRKFWGGLRPSQPSNPRRLLIYAVVIVLSSAVAPTAAVLHVFEQLWSEMSADRRRVAARFASLPSTWFQQRFPGATTQQVLDRFAPEPTPRLVAKVMFAPVMSRMMIAHAMPLLWPALSFLPLMIFVTSMRRARVRRAHFARCIVYAADVVVWANGLLALLVVGQTLRRVLLGGPSDLPDQFAAYRVAAATVFALALLAFVYRLIVAFKKYLHFDHPVSTVLATQVIVFLCMLLLLIPLM